MIFVVTGSQGSFDRLINVVDDWAERAGRDDVFAQLSESSEPRHIAWKRYITPEEFQDRVDDADLVISHAGMGTILSALTTNTPVIVMPRRAHLGEQRSDHQMATAKQLREVAGLPVAFDEQELRAALENIEELLEPRARIERSSLGDLRSVVRGFLLDAARSHQAKRRRR